MKRAAIALLLFVASAAAADPAGKYFADLKLVDQNGRTVDLYTDLMSGNIVVINSFFATCHGSCPVMSAALRRIETTFGHEAARRLVLISITVDPENDTPAKLKQYAARFEAGSNWHFLTGSKEQVGLALQKLGFAVDSRETHQNVFVVGNLRTGLWKKVLGIAGVDEVVQVVRTVVEDRGETRPSP